MLLTGAVGCAVGHAVATQRSRGPVDCFPGTGVSLKILAILNAYARKQEGAFGLRSSGNTDKHLKCVGILEHARREDNVSAFAAFRRCAAVTEAADNCNDYSGIFLLTVCIPLCPAVHV